MEQANMGVSTHNYLTIKFENQPQDTVSSRMLGSKINSVGISVEVVLVIGNLWFSQNYQPWQMSV